jgi:hypothetical protein
MTSLTDKNFVFVNPKEMLEMLEDLFAQYFIEQSPVKDFPKGHSFQEIKDLL